MQMLYQIQEDTFEEREKKSSQAPAISATKSFCAGSTSHHFFRYDPGVELFRAHQTQLDGNFP